MSRYTRRERIIVLVLSLGSFTGVLNVYLLTPLLGLVARQFHLSQAAVGQLSTIYALVGAMVGLLAAPLMDRYQRKYLLQLGLVVVGVGAALSATAPSFVMLLAARALAGCGAALLMSCCYAAAGDVFPDANQRNRCLGILMSASGIGAVVGFPVLTKLATALGWRWAVASLLVPIVLLIAGASLLPRRQLAERRVGLVADYLTRYRQVLAQREVNWLLAASLLWYVAWTVPLIYSVPIWIGEFHLSLGGYGWVFSVAGVVFFLGSNLAPTLLRRLAPYRGFAVGASVHLAAALSFALTAGRVVPALIVFCGCIALAGAVVAVGLNVLLLDALPEARGAVLGLSGTTSQAGFALGGILGGLTLAAFGGAALIPSISLLIPAAALACWRSTRRSAPAPSQAEVLAV